MHHAKPEMEIEENLQVASGIEHPWRDQNTDITVLQGVHVCGTSQKKDTPPSAISGADCVLTFPAQCRTRSRGQVLTGHWCKLLPVNSVSHVF